MRPLRVAHVGNIAQNAYLNAKAQRASGIDARSFDFGGGPALWTPQWEDGDWQFGAEAPTDSTGFYDWRAVPMLNGFSRPTWAHILGWNGVPPWFATEEDYYAVWHTRPKRSDFQQLLRDEGRALRRDLRRCGYQRDEAVRAVAAEHDLTVLYGPEAAYGVSLPREARYVTFECSTMRSVPLRDTPDRRVLAAAYQLADACIITNADCRAAAEELGVGERSRFIPHPIDLEKFHPGPADAQSRAFMLNDLGVDLLFLAPARQQPIGVPDAKLNHRIFGAFRRYVQEAERDGAPRAGLLCLLWGQNTLEAIEWVKAMGLAERVRWLIPMPKTKMAALYRDVDLVLDQFATSVGSYGTTSVEACASGIPLITHIDEDRHAWCRDVLPTPPHWQASEIEDIYTGMVTLAHSQGTRANQGEAGVQWAREWCGPERIAGLHQALYEEVLSRA